MGAGWLVVRVLEKVQCLWVNVEPAHFIEGYQGERVSVYKWEGWESLSAVVLPFEPRFPFHPICFKSGDEEDGEVVQGVGGVEMATF